MMASILLANSGTTLNHARSLLRAFAIWQRQRHADERVLLERYAEAVGIERELADLPGPYAAPAIPRPPTARRLPPVYTAVDGFARVLSPAELAPAELTPMELTQNEAAIARLPVPANDAARGGSLLVAYSGGTPAGCVALRDQGGDVCELKHLFVPVDFRGLGIGRALADRAMSEARRLGYARMRLAVSRRQLEAIALSEKIGFFRILPFGDQLAELASWLVFYERRL